MDYAQILISPTTKLQLQAFLRQPSGSVMLNGPSGSGKKFLARQISASILNTPIEQLDNHPFFMVVERQESKQDISIDQIRAITRFLKLKTTKVGDINRVVMVSGAEAMNEEAQNALLKMLEEPNRDSVFILTATSSNAVLPTVASRCQQIRVARVSLEAARQFFASADELALNSAWQLSNGKAGLLSALMNKGNDHPLKSSVEQAKHWLQATKYERLVSAAGIGKSKENLQLFLDSLAIILTSLHRQAIQKNNRTLQAKILDSRKLVMKLKEDSLSNASPKLICDTLVLQLKI